MSVLVRYESAFFFFSDNFSIDTRVPSEYVSSAGRMFARWEKIERPNPSCGGKNRMGTRGGGRKAR